MSKLKMYRRLSFLGFPQYRVGRDGSFWRFTMTRGWKRRRTNSVGVVGLNRGKVLKMHTLGSLVLRAFVGPPPPKMECCHFPDRDVLNNNLTNLRWDTHRSNMLDRRKHGTETVAKINQQKADRIRKLYATGAFTMRELGDLYGLTVGTIHPIIHRKTWLG